MVHLRRVFDSPVTRGRNRRPRLFALPHLLTLVRCALCAAAVFAVAIAVVEPVQGQGRADRREYPTVNLPLELRQQNWTGSAFDGNGFTIGGSCVHATMVSLFRWQGLDELADAWRAQHGGGAGLERISAQLDAWDVQYVADSSGNVRFLEWACDTRRGCGISIYEQQGSGRWVGHFVALVHLDSERAGILDNNCVHHIHWYRRDALIAKWLNAPWHWAVTPVYSPAPPLPYVE